MLVVKCEERLAKVREFAKTLTLTTSRGEIMNGEQQLQYQLDYLASYACHEENGKDYTRCELHSDFAPHSFAFCMFVKDKTKREGKEYDKDGYTFWFNGGLIAQLPNMPANGSAPSFTVSLAEGSGWRIHT